MLFGDSDNEKETSTKEVGTIISQGTKIEGEIEVKESIRIDGELEGKLVAQGDILVGKSGSLTADLKGDNIEIAGEIEGNVSAEGRLKLLKNAKLIGDISYSNLVINDGAVFKGTSISQVNEKEAKKKVNNYKVKIETELDNLNEAFALRKEVFVAGQGVPEDVEIDDKEDRAYHFLVKNNRELVATCRVRIIDNYAKLERMAVKEGYRKQGIGSLLIDRVEEFVKDKNLAKIKLHAQVKVQDFYEKNDYQLSSEEEFMEAGIRHVKMEKKI
ncbi:MAG: GNAT family N-acetyltransferase [Halanaerobacter sp.]